MKNYVKANWLLFTFSQCLAVALFGTFLRSASSEEPTWMDKLIPVNYSKYIPPKNITDEQKNVTCHMLPTFLTKISTLTMDFEINFALIVMWYDNRLQLPDKRHEVDKHDKILRKDVSEKLWHPDIIVNKCKNTVCELIDPQSYGPEGMILISFYDHLAAGELSVDYSKPFCVACDFNLAAYPFDVQKCSFELSLYNDVDRSHRIQLDVGEFEGNIPVPPGYVLGSFLIGNCANQTRKTRRGFRECAALIFEFRRIFSQHLMLVYFPSILVVIISWLSFWVELDKPGPRVTLGLTNLLTLATTFAVAQRDLPPVAHIKALEIWMFVCMFMIFSSLIEFGLAKSFFAKKQKGPKQVRPQSRYCFKSSNSIGAYKRKARLPFLRVSKIAPSGSTKLSRSENTNSLDYAARFVFPLTFLTFNIVYWAHFLP